MPFAALDDEFFGHRKTVAAGLDGCGLYSRSLSYCAHYLTDGWVPKDWAAEIAKPAVRRKVTAAGFWIEVDGGESFEYLADGAQYEVTIPGPGFFIPDYLEFNPTRASVELKRSELSKKRSEAGKKGAQVRWQRQRQTDGKGNGNALATAWPPSPTPLSASKAVTSSRPDAPERPVENIKNLIDQSLKEAS